jgi:hypothetical protein
MSAPEPIVKAVKYWVSCVPEDHQDASIFTLVVEYSHRHGWAVRDGARFVAADGTKSYTFGWDREPITDEEIARFNAEYEAWLKVFRFADEETALRVAREQAPKMRVLDYTVEDALTESEGRKDG